MERRKVPVVYYLSRNGHLEHPHFLEVPLSSSDQGLYLRDVIGMLSQIRGKNMASMYSWSSKRSYRNGYVWQDLSHDDIIHPPSHGHEYILKGSELLLRDASSSSFGHHRNYHHHPHPHPHLPAALSPITDKQSKVSKPSSLQAQSWSSNGEYKVYKLPAAAAARSLAGGGSDMATQTGEEEDRERRRLVGGGATELREDVSPPPSSSSSSTETLGMSGRLRVSEALMQLIACGSRSVKDGGSTESQRGMGMRDQGRRLSVDARDSFA